MMNVLNGGEHADSNLDVQEFMILPLGAPTFSESLRYGAETFQALKAVLHEKGLNTAVGDEGGFAPKLRATMKPPTIVAAIERAGYQPGKDVAIALDPASSSFWEKSMYRLTRSGQGNMNARR